ITTVGYGDMYPITPFGRGVAVFLMLTGITLFGLLTASVASFFIEEDGQSAEHNSAHHTKQLNKVLKQLSVQQPVRKRFHLARYRAQLASRHKK
ncbi:potassium channel family protein, partial [Vibrio sp. V01_P9A10T6]